MSSAGALGSVLWHEVPAARAAAVEAPAAPDILHGVPKPPEYFRLVGAPVVQAPADTTATIVWAVNDTSTGWVEYGDTPALGQKRAAGDCGLLPSIGRSRTGCC